MPDNTFENKLGERMGGFKYTPSDIVWHKLENDLRKRKKRRWAIIWFFSGLAVLTTGLFFLAQMTIPSPGSSFIADTGKIVNKENRIGTRNNDKNLSVPGSDSAKVYMQIRQSPPIGPEISEKSENTKVVGTLKNETAAVDHQKKKDKSTDFILTKRKEGQHGRYIEFNISKSAGDQQKEKVTAEKNNDLTKDITALKHSKSLNLTEESTLQELAEKDSSYQGVAIKEDVSVMLLQAPEIIRSSVDTATVLQKQQHTAANKFPLTFGARLETGRSANNESAFTLAKSADLQSVPASGGPSSFSYPYSQDPAFGWSLGMWLKKPVSQRVSFLIGIAYQQYQTQTAVGAQGQGAFVFNNGVGDSVISRYYVQGNLDTYENRFHMFSIPVEMNLQLNKGKRLPFSWQLGLSPGWIISSNALLNDTSGILYSDNHMLQHFQLGLLTGFSFRLWNKAVHPLELGPVFRYMVTPSFNSGATYDGHLSFAGLRADWTIFKYKPRQR
jgi:hypothetical protein